jgi:hypothetical protein
MKQYYSILVYCAIALCSVSHADVLIQSFTNEGNFGYVYGSWKGQTQTGPLGLEIEGSATASGGGGTYFKAPLDLSDESSLEITLQQLPSNKVRQFNLLLKTQFGSGEADYYISRYTFTLPSSKVSAFVKVSVALDPASVTAGNSGPVDLSKVNEFQIQGNYANDTDAFHLVLWEVRATRK